MVKNIVGGKHDSFISMLYYIYILSMDVILYVSLVYTRYSTFCLLKVKL